MVDHAHGEKTDPCTFSEDRAGPARPLCIRRIGRKAWSNIGYVSNVPPAISGTRPESICGR